MSQTASATPVADADAPMQFSDNFRAELANRFGLTEPFVQRVFGKGNAGRNIDRWEDLVNPQHKLSSAYVHFALSNVVRGRQARDLITRETGIAGGSSLDVGSAYGGMVAAFAEAGFKAEGVEIDAHWCALGNLNCHSKGLGTPIRLGDFLADGSGFGTYDVVTCNDVIEHVAEPRRALVKMSAMVNLGGALYLVIPNGRSWDHVIRDGHYGEFGLNLLDHHSAKAYYDARCRTLFGKDYSCGEFYDLDWYVDVLAGCGLDVRVHRPKKAVLPTGGEFEQILAKLDAAHAAWKPAKLSEILADNVHNAFHRYRRTLLRDYYAAVYEPKLYAQHFSDTYLAPFWTVIARTGQKPP